MTIGQPAISRDEGRATSDQRPATALIAIGGNSLIRVGEKGTNAEQLGNARRTAAAIVGLIRDGWRLVLTHGNELKVVFPQPGLDPAQLEPLDFEHFFLQPMDGARLAENTRAALEYCLAHPRWRLSLQTHKALGIR